MVIILIDFCFSPFQFYVASSVNCMPDLTKPKDGGRQFLPAEMVNGVINKVIEKQKSATAKRNVEGK